jgi:hypothetical protein
MSHEAKESAVQEAIHCARAVLAGEIDVLEACVTLHKLADAVVPSWVEDPDFQIFGAIASECDGIPLGEARKQWKDQALARIDADAQRYSQIVREEVVKACQNVVSRFAVTQGHPANGSAV